MPETTPSAPVASVAMVTIDCADATELATFYSRLLGMTIAYQDDSVAMITGDPGPRLPAGTVTLRNVYETIGGYTRQNVVVVRPTGAALREAVEKAHAKAGLVVTGREQAYPAYFAGLNGRIVRDGDAVRWENPAVNGRPLDPNATYTLAAGAYPMMEYPSLMASPVVSDQVGWVKPLVAQGMQERRVIRPYLFGLTLPEPPAPPTTP